MMVSVLVKTVIADTVARLPTYRSQSVAAAVVRRVWPGFSRA
jgi:hypothetical protein